MSHDVPQRAPGRDRWLAWPAAASLVAALVLTLLSSLPGAVSFFLIPARVLGGPIVGVGLLALASVKAVNRRPRTGVSILMAAVLPVALEGPVTWTSDNLHLALTAWTGSGRLGDPAGPKAQPFVVYDWSVGLAGGQNTFLIFDATDQIARPSADVRGAGELYPGIRRACSGRTVRLIRHYYVCRY